MGRRHKNYLLTPGPLTTAKDTREAMLYDKSPNSPEMVKLVRNIRHYLLDLADGSKSHECVPIQGSATYGIEAVFQTLVDKDSADVLVVENGFYGMRLREVIEAVGHKVTKLEIPIVPPLSITDLEKALKQNPNITHIAMCHCDTGTGVLNPLENIANFCKEKGIKLIIDAIASFGGFDISASKLDFESVIISPNKSLEAVPGVAFVICKRNTLLSSKGRANSSVLDLYAQWSFMEEKGWFRTTPPTHVLLAIANAVEKHRSEGGIVARNKRYRRNWRRLVEGLRQYGFVTFMPDKFASPIIATFHDPDDPNYTFEKFYAAMEKRGFVIFPGRLTSAHTFRIGTMGDLKDSDISLIIEAVMEAMDEIGVTATSPKPERLITA